MKAVTKVDRLKAAKRQLNEQLAKFMVGLLNFAGYRLFWHARIGTFYNMRQGVKRDKFK